MTNEKIILLERMSLLKAGKIGTTGRVFRLDNGDGTTTDILEPEEIHTFAAWKERGMSVKKGEHAVTKLTIWKAGKGKKAPETEEQAENPEKTRMFLKTAHFFAASQVEPTKEKAATA